VVLGGELHIKFHSIGEELWKRVDIYLRP